MKANCVTFGRRASLCLGIISLLAVTAVLSSCGSGISLNHTPKFLVAANGTSGNNLEVLPIDSTTGALGTPVSGSPFDFGAGLSDPYAIATHPKHGNWIYVCDWAGGPSKVAAISLAEDGTPTLVNTANTSTDDGCDYTYSMTITPNGKYLYTADYDSSDVSMFAIDQTNGGLTGLGTFSTGLTGDADAITATDSFVFVNTYYGNQISALKINSGGTLSCPTSGCPTRTESAAKFNAMSVDRSGKFLYATSNSDDLLYGYSIGSDGTLTPVSSGPAALTNGDWFGQIVFSVDNKSLYVADESNAVFGFSFNSANGAVTAHSSTYPNSSGYAMTVAVDPSNGFVYSDDDGDAFFGWKRDKSTGVLTSIGAADTPLATSANSDVNAIAITF